MATQVNINKQVGMTINGEDIFSPKPTIADTAMDQLDDDWAKTSFLLGSTSLQDVDAENRFFSSGYVKFTDSSVGGAYCINPLPGACPYADTPVKGMLTTRSEVTVGDTTCEFGSGQYWEEAFEENQQLIYVRMGVPTFNSLTTFFTGMYNSSAGSLVNTGRTKGIFYNAGKAAGTLLGIVYWPILVVSAIGTMWRFFSKKPTSKYYYLKPTMPQFWASVHTMVNRMAVDQGILPRVMTSETDQKMNTAYGVDAEMLSNLHALAPDIFSPDGNIDVYSLVSRTQRTANLLDQIVHEDFNQGTVTDFRGYVKKFNQNKLAKPKGKYTSIFNYIEEYITTEVVVPSGSKTENAEPDMKGYLNQPAPAASTPSSPTAVDPSQVKTPPAKFGNFLDAELRDGTAFLVLRVDHTGPSSESFSNSVGESDLQSKLNNTSQQAQMANFSFAGGNISDGALGTMVGGVLSAAKDVITGALDGLNMGGLIGLAGSAFVDIPKHWTSSMAQLPRSTYTMRLKATSGNVISRLLNIGLPLACILNMTLPRSTGKQTYSSPYVIEMYDPGNAQSRLCMVDSLSISRGVGNLGFTQTKHALAIDITFSFVDMSSILHIPVSSGFGFFDDDGIFDEENSYSDYMAIVSALGIKEQIYTASRSKLMFARQIRKAQALTSTAMWAMMAHDKTPLKALDIFYRGSSILPDKG